MPRQQPKFLFELSAREAQELINTIPQGHAPLRRTLERLRQFRDDAQELPLTEDELDSLGMAAIDRNPGSEDFVAYNLPPGQQRREWLEYVDEESGHRATGPEEGC